MIALRRAVSALTLTDVLCFALVVWGVFAWQAGILHGGFDHDEFEHTHAIWLISHGRRPFYDFFECHPPFLWYPLVPLVRLVGDRYAILFVLRFLTALGHLAFFVALARNVSLSLDRLAGQRTSRAELARLFVPGLLVLAAHPAVLLYLLEFRMDSWPNALLLSAIYRYRASPRDPLRSSAELGFLATIAVACSPKLLVFAAAFIGLDQVSRAGAEASPPARTGPIADLRVRRLAGLAAGGIAAALSLLLILLALRLDPRVVFRLVIGYQAQFNEHAGFGHGLAQSIWEKRVLLAIVVASAVAFVAHVKGRLRSHPFESAIIVFLGVQLLLVRFANKQYYGPWFLMATGLTPHLIALAGRVRLLRPLVIAAAIVYGAFNLFDDHQQYAHQGRAAAEIALRQRLLELSPPGGSVVVSMERHPLFRFDTLYHVVSSSGPSGYGTNQIMTTMNLAPFSARFSPEFYQRELEEMPPDLIVLKGWFTPGQRQGIEAFLARHAGDYRRVDTPLGPTLVRQALTRPAGGQISPPG
ncbi:MAG TPA: hypothetical protein VIF57_18925 [Polyangia bacterium]|jgi:hypothetical protein